MIFKNTINTHNTSNILRVTASALAICFCVAVTSSTALATGQSLDDIINQATEEQQQANTSQSSTVVVDTAPQTTQQAVANQAQANRDFIEGLTNASDLTKPDIEAVNKANSTMAKVVAGFVQVLIYAIVLLLTVRVLFDLMYVKFTFTRPLLNKGGDSAPAPAASTGSGWGMNNTPSPQSSSSGKGYCLVSDAAIKAVQPQDGKSPMKAYMSDTIITLVLVPILIVLAATGTLTRLGFSIGYFLVDLIGNGAARIGL